MQTILCNVNFIVPLYFSHCTNLNFFITPLFSALEPSKKHSDGNKMYQIESFSWLWGHHARKLVNESVGTFMALQDALAEVEPDNCIPILVKKSREYR